ncbi:MAG: hypothetical protein HGB23_11330 [Chlorobiaceae bacterium]|nr:hypothetical protein [Chlorobiaceae bacterium]
MKHKPFSLVVFAGLFFLLSSFTLQCEVAAKTHDDPNEELYETEAAYYFLGHFRSTKRFYKEFFDSGGTDKDTAKVVLLMKKNFYLKRATKHDAPWTVQELDKIYLQKKGSPFSVSLSGDLSDLTQYDDSAIKTATFELSKDNLNSGRAAWKTEGLIGYYYHVDDNHGNERASVDWKIGFPVVAWKLDKKQGVPSDTNIDELQFSLPINVIVAPKTQHSSLWVLQARPYYQTDFAFGYTIFGGELLVEPTGRVPGLPLYVGGYQNIWPNYDVQYQLRMIPKLDYSVTNRSGAHTTRAVGDDWVRAGGMASLYLRLGGSVPDVGVSFETLQNVQGNSKIFNLFKADATFWLNNNKSVSLKGTYYKGTTLEAGQKIDSVTFGLGVRY